MTNIFVAKLDYGVTQEDLKAEFEQFGRVNKVSIAMDKETGKSKGFAFIEMFDENEADEAIKSLDGLTLKGRQIAVKKADDRSNSRPDNRGGSNERAEFNPRKDFGERKTYEKLNNDLDKQYKKLDLIDDIKPALIPTNPDKLKVLDRKKDAPKKVDKEKKLMDGKPKQQKMPAYKKSGKNNRFFDLDDDDY
jgi:RNA recognition motif-containing protein